jgi:protein disulfide-isomerase
MRLKKEVFESKEFADYAARNLVLVEVDFPRKKKQSDELSKSNEALQKKYKTDGQVPTIILLNADGKEVSRTVGNILNGPKAWIAAFDEARKK